MKFSTSLASRLSLVVAGLACLSIVACTPTSPQLKQSNLILHPTQVLIPRLLHQLMTKRNLSPSSELKKMAGYLRF